MDVTKDYTVKLIDFDVAYEAVDIDLQELSRISKSIKIDQPVGSDLWMSHELYTAQCENEIKVKSK